MDFLGDNMYNYIAKFKGRFKRYLQLVKSIERLLYMYEYMQRGQKAALVGLDSERIIITLINTDNQFKNLIKRCLKNLGFNIKGNIKASKNEVKIDIYIEGKGIKIGASIKTTSLTSFHHLDRRWLKKWKETINISDDIYKILKDAIFRKSQNRSERFILSSDEEKLKNFFLEHSNEIINEIFTHSENDLKLFIINDQIKYKLYLYKMEDVVDFLIHNIKNKISFSSKGIIQLGDFITMQRKGGDGTHISIPKTDLNHPGNQLQFKFSPIKFLEYLEKTKAIKFCIIQFKIE